MESKYTNHFSHKIVKNKACRLQFEAKPVIKVVKVLPSSAHRAPKCSKMQPRAVIFPYFSVLIARLGPTISQGCFRRPTFSSKRPSGQPKPRTNIHIDTEHGLNNQTTGQTFGQHSASTSALSHLSRSTSLDPLRYGNFHSVRSTLLYDD